MHRLLNQKEKKIYTPFPYFSWLCIFFKKRGGREVVKTESQTSQTYNNTVGTFLALLYDELKPITFPSYNLEQSCRDQSQLLVKN